MAIQTRKGKKKTTCRVYWRNPISHQIEYKKFDDKVNNFLRFAMDNFETELVVMGIKLALTQYSLPIDPDAIECFDEFHERYGKYITAAQKA